ncbi:MAG: response regulator [Candidatus Hydrogenedentota bacterium]
MDQANNPSNSRRPIRILHLDDNPRDVELIRGLLEADEFDCEVLRVDMRENFEAALSKGSFDLILCDFNLPQYSGFSALKFVKENYLDTPVILVTGTLSEEDAVNCLKLGAADFVLKQRLVRLVPSVKRALREVEQERQRRQAEQKLQEEERRFRLIAENVTDLITLVDTEGRRIYSNPACSVLMAAETLQTGADAFGGLHFDDQERVRRAFAETAATGMGERTEYRIVAQKGSVHDIESQSSAIRDASGRITSVLIVGRDITERKQQEQDRLAREIAEQANAAKSAFLATMSHEIRTPMNGVVGIVDLLSKTNLQPYQTDLVDTMRESAYSLLTVIDDILDFSKIEAGKLELELEPVPVTRVVEAACDTLQPLAMRKLVELFLYTDPALPDWVLCDSMRLRQVLSNLVGNAIKFSSGQARDGRVRVRAEWDGAASMLHLTVKDNGIGIASEMIGKLFTPFTQEDRSTTRRFGGSGLGLSICKRLVTLMNGAIEVESEPGRGSTFSVALPMSPVENLSPPPPPPDLSSVTCFVAIPDAELAADWVTYLEYAGASAAVATTQEAAAAQLEASGATGLVVVVSGQPRRAMVDPAALQAVFVACAAQVGHVLITRGHRRAPREAVPGVVTIDGAMTHRDAFLGAVAMAAGLVAPIAKPDSAPASPSQPSPLSVEEAAAQGRLILVAEDNEINQKVIRLQLQQLGYAAEIAGDGREALEYWKTGRHALLLTDLHMPNMDGYELSYLIRQEEHANQHLPIIALTANVVKGGDTMGLASGMDDYLTKPVQLEKLNKALARWMPAGGHRPASAISHAETAERTASALPVLDISVLTKLVGGGQELVAQFLGDYLESAQKAAREFRAAFSSGDWRAVKDVAHRFKSSSRSVGALAMGECCDKLEEAGTAGDGAAITALMPDFERALAEVTRAIERNDGEE